MESNTYRSIDGQITLNVNIGTLKAGKLLEGKVVLITGGTRGIGLHIAMGCIYQGAKVIITGRNEKALNEAKTQLGENCHCICHDITDFFSYDRLLEQATEPFGYVDCLVNNAGISLHEGDFMNVSLDSWDAQIDTNLKAPYFFTQAWLRYYQKSGLKQGHIVMIASDTSGMGSTIPYGITKAGISSFTRGLAKHVIRNGIRINAIAPGTTKTEMTDDFVRGQIVRTSTEGWRVLFPEEIAGVCVFLLSNMSTCISGQVIGCTEANVCFDNTEDNVATELETNP